MSITVRLVDEHDLKLSITPYRDGLIIALRSQVNPPEGEPMRVRRWRVVDVMPAPCEPLDVIPVPAESFIDTLGLFDESSVEEVEHRVEQE